MSDVVPQVCSGMANTDVLAVPGEYRQDGAGGAKVRSVVLTLFNDDEGELLLPDGSRLVFPDGVAWLVSGKITRARTGSGNEGSTSQQNVQFTVFKSGSDVVTIDDVQVNSSYSFGVYDTDKITVSAVQSGYVADHVAYLTISEIPRS